MKLNGAKFQALRYCPNEALKNNTEYFTAIMEDIIEQFPSLKDLGVIMSDTGSFQERIEKVCSKVKQ